MDDYRVARRRDGAGGGRRLTGGRGRLAAGQEHPQDRLGAEPVHAQPFRRPGRGGLLALGDQLGPARQLQPQGPHPGPGHRPELGHLGRQEDDHIPSRPQREVVGRQADHLGGRQVLPRGAGQQGRPVHELHGQRLQDRDAERRHGRGPHQAPRRPDRRRPLHLHPPQARLGEGAGQRPHRLV